MASLRVHKCFNDVLMANACLWNSVGMHKPGHLRLGLKASTIKLFRVPNY
jgi:hypothetical protein